MTEIDGNGIKPNKEKVEAILQLKPPENNTVLIQYDTIQLLEYKAYILYSFFTFALEYNNMENSRTMPGKFLLN